MNLLIIINESFFLPGNEWTRATKATKSLTINKYLRWFYSDICKNSWTTGRWSLSNTMRETCTFATHRITSHTHTRPFSKESETVAITAVKTKARKLFLTNGKTCIQFGQPTIDHIHMLNWPHHIARDCRMNRTSFGWWTVTFLLTSSFPFGQCTHTP